MSGNLIAAILCLLLSVVVADDFPGLSILNFGLALLNIICYLS